MANIPWIQDVRNVAAIARASLELLQLRRLSGCERERIAVMHLRSLDRLKRLLTEDERRFVLRDLVA